MYDSMSWKQDVFICEDVVGSKFSFQENLNFRKKILWLGVAGKSDLVHQCLSIKRASDLGVVLNCSRS